MFSLGNQLTTIFYYEQYEECITSTLMYFFYKIIFKILFSVETF